MTGATCCGQRYWGNGTGSSPSRWRQFPNKDRTPENLAALAIAFQRHCGFHFVNPVFTRLYGGGEDCETVPQYFPGTLTLPIPRMTAEEAEIEVFEFPPASTHARRHPWLPRESKCSQSLLGLERSIFQRVVIPVTWEAL